MALPAVFGAASLAAGLWDGLSESQGDMAPPRAVIAAIALAGALGGFLVFRPQDWRNWIGFAATREGLYLPGRGRGVVFVPWANQYVSALDV